MAIDGKWNLVIKTPMGEQTGVLTLKQDGDALTGEMVGSTGTAAVENGRVDGDKLTWGWQKSRHQCRSRLSLKARKKVVI